VQADDSQDASSTINFQSGVTGTITLTSQLPGLSKNITINGPGSSSLTVARGSSAPKFTVFTAGADTTDSIQGMTITGGSTGQGGNGGGVQNFGALTLIGVSLTGNSAGYGGGVYNSANGTLTLSACSVYSNTATVEGGGIYSNGGTVNIVSGSNVYSNSAASGGGIFNVSGSTLSIRDSSRIYSNSATTGDGGGIWNAGQLTMSGGKIDGNSAGVGYGGGLYQTYSTASASLTNVSLTNNSANGANGKGGGFYLDQGSLTLNTCTVSGNKAPFGNGGAWKTGSTYTAINCTITDNVVQDP
jgi:hypothetical protein